MDIDDLNYEFFQDKHFCGNVRNEIEQILGLNVSNASTEIEQKKRKASLRNMVSYLFQHQNLIASKFALFYRFTDYYKRKDVIDQFPIFAGIVNQEYYSDLLLLEEYRNQLKQLIRKQKENEKSITYVKDRLIFLLKNYFSLLNMEFDEAISIREALDLAKKLPTKDQIEFSNEKIAQHYYSLKDLLNELREKERTTLLKEKSLKQISNVGDEYKDKLNEISEQTKVCTPSIAEYNCPLCGARCEHINEKDKIIFSATAWLDNELSSTKFYSDEFNDDIRKLEIELDGINREIKKVWKQIKEIEDNYLNSKQLKERNDEINYAKAQILLFVDMQKDGIFNDKDEEIESLQSKIRIMEEKIEGFNYKERISEAQAFLTLNMNKLATTLDFEEEYKPIDLKFGLEDGSFDLHQHQKNNENIYLYEMGSGANWVSSHIALFLSFLHYFAMQENSPMPLTMFFDQPSQVYFPQGQDELMEFTSSDLNAVNRMYKTMFDEIKTIEKETGVLPQLIIVDHVTGEGMEIKEEFNSYIRCSWRDGNALI
jgi:hypothetical protein